MDGQNQYPAMRFLLRYGKLIAWLVGLALIILGIWMYAAGAGLLHSGGLIAGGLLSTLILLVLRELVHIIADTLLPPE